MAEWQSDWATFVRNVVADLECGLSDEVITEKFRDQRVEWMGTVARTNFGDLPSVALEMLPVNVKMADGRYGVTNWLSLVIASSDIPAWNKIKLGQRIRFQTSVCKGYGPFPGLKWADVGNKKGYVSISTNPSVLLGVIGEDV